MDEMGGGGMGVWELTGTLFLFTHVLSQYVRMAGNFSLLSVGDLEGQM